MWQDADHREALGHKLKSLILFIMHQRVTVFLIFCFLKQNYCLEPIQVLMLAYSGMTEEGIDESQVDEYRG